MRDRSVCLIDRDDNSQCMGHHFGDDSQCPCSFEGVSHTRTQTTRSLEAAAAVAELSDQLTSSKEGIPVGIGNSMCPECEKLS